MFGKMNIFLYRFFCDFEIINILLSEYYVHNRPNCSYLQIAYIHRSVKMKDV